MALSSAHFRWYADDGWDPATPLAAENATVYVSTTANRRLRFSVYNGGASGVTLQQIKLQYSQYANFSSPVDVSFSPGALFQPADGVGISGASIGTLLLSDSDDPAVFVETYRTEAYTVPAGGTSEFDFTIVPTSLPLGTDLTYYFRIVDGRSGSPVGSGTHQPPSLIFAAPGSDATVSATGEAAGAAPGGPTFSASIAAVGLAASLAVGTVAIGIANLVAPSGLGALLSGGTVSMSSGGATAPTGVSTTSTGGTTLQAGAATSAATGASASASYGSQAVNASAQAAPPGEAIAGATGNVAPSGNAVAAPVGAAAYAAAGSAALGDDRIAYPPGIEAGSSPGGAALVVSSVCAATGMSASSEGGSAVLLALVEALPAGHSAAASNGGATASGSAEIASGGVQCAVGAGPATLVADAASPATGLLVAILGGVATIAGPGGSVVYPLGLSAVMSRGRVTLARLLPPYRATGAVSIVFKTNAATASPRATGRASAPKAEVPPV